MSVTRHLLNCLGRGSLVRLLRGRQLAMPAKNEERRAALVRSYRGDVEVLIAELTAEDLVAVFGGLSFVHGGQLVYLPNPGAYGLDELRAFARRAFANRRVRIPAPFEPVPSDKTGAAAAHAHVAEGVEADDRGAEKANAPRNETEQRPRRARAKSGSHPAISTPVVDHTPEISRTVISVRPEPPLRPTLRRLPDYDLAVLRLRFLTAIPSVQRARMPEWPHGYVDAATRGLSLLPQERRLLETQSVGLCLGTHSPYEAIPHLKSALDRAQWSELVDDLRRLNPFQPEMVDAIVEQVSSIAVELAPTSTATRVDLSLLPKAAKPASAPPTSAVAHNIRSTGPLDTMFD